MTKTTTQHTGALRSPAGARKAMLGLILASFFMTMTNAARADVFGSSGGAQPQAQAQTQALIDRLTALEKELKDLKAGGTAGTTGDAAQKGQKKAGAPNLKLPAPPPGLEGLPGGGADERERLLVQKELTYEVLGTVNGQLIVRDGEHRFLFSDKEFKAFEKTKREKVVMRMKLDAVSESEGGKVSFPELQPPPPPTDIAGAAPADTTLSQAGQVVNQARALEANGGRLPAPVPAPSKPTVPAPTKSTAPVTPGTTTQPAAHPVLKH